MLSEGCVEVVTYCWSGWYQGTYFLFLLPSLQNKRAFWYFSPCGFKSCCLLYRYIMFQTTTFGRDQCHANKSTPVWNKNTPKPPQPTQNHLTCRLVQTFLEYLAPFQKRHSDLGDSIPTSKSSGKQNRTVACNASGDTYTQECNFSFYAIAS